MEIAEENRYPTLFLCGDVMTGRGIDQIFPQSAPPFLFEPYVKDAHDYVKLAEIRNGLIERPVPFAYIWGEALPVLDRLRPALRLINLETSVTLANQPWSGKSIHYRMHPQNLGCLTAAQIDMCALANNHVLDWGYSGLRETLETLPAAGIRCMGAGINLSQAQQPVIFPLREHSRVIVFSCGSPDSGIPENWGATGHRAGVFLLPDYSTRSVELLARLIKRCKQSGDIVVLSIHWGSNWGYGIEPEQRQFSHRVLEEAGVDIIHGHSSHHPRPIEVHNGKLILYGCGDFINDYEGIRGYEAFRSDLRLMYFATCEPATGKLRALTMVPLQMHRFRLRQTSQEDMQWLAQTLSRVGAQFGNCCRVNPNGILDLEF